MKHSDRNNDDYEALLPENELRENELREKKEICIVNGRCTLFIFYKNVIIFLKPSKEIEIATSKIQGVPREK